MTKEKSKNLIKKVRKEIKLPKNFGLVTNEDSNALIKEAYKKGFEDAVLKFREPKEEKNHAITVIIVWLAILTVLAIYVSIK